MDPFSLTIALLFVALVVTGVAVTYYLLRPSALVGPTGPTGAPAMTPGQIGPTGRAPLFLGPVGPQRAASSVSVNYPGDNATSDLLVAPINYILPLQAVVGRFLAVDNLNPNIFEVNTNATGYSVTVVFKRPTSGPPTWIGGTVTYDAYFFVGNIVYGSILAVGYSAVANAPLTSITRINSAGYGTDGTDTSSTEGGTISLTLPFVVSVPAGPTPVQFFSYLDLTQGQQATLGQAFTFGYTMEIHLL